MAQNETPPVTQPTVDYNKLFDERFPEAQGSSPVKALDEFDKRFDELFPEEQKPEEPGWLRKVLGH